MGGVKVLNGRLRVLDAAQTANLARADAYAKSLFPVIQEIRAAHVTALRKIAQCLNARGFKTPNNRAFKAQSVKNLLERIAVAATTPEPDSDKRNAKGSRPKPCKLGTCNP